MSIEGGIHVDGTERQHDAVVQVAWPLLALTSNLTPHHLLAQLHALQSALVMCYLPAIEWWSSVSAGRPLELAEEAVVLGAHQSCLYYRLVSQKSEGGSLTEGGARAWFWDESEVVDDSLQVVGKGKGHGVALP
jgi:hypothetical protein